MRIRSESTRYALEQAAALSEPLPEPPQRLTPEARAFWETVVTAKRRNAWTDNDLTVACSLCRDMALLEQLAEELEEYGPTLVNKDGRRYSNPAATIMDATQRRVLATCRQLQIHSVATTGKTEGQPNKNAAARDLAGKINGASDLIKRVK